MNAAGDIVRWYICEIYGRRRDFPREHLPQNTEKVDICAPLVVKFTVIGLWFTVRVSVTVMVTIKTFSRVRIWG